MSNRNEFESKDVNGFIPNKKKKIKETVDSYKNGEISFIEYICKVSDLTVDLIYLTYYHEYDFEDDHTFKLKVKSSLYFTFYLVISKNTGKDINWNQINNYFTNSFGQLISKYYIDVNSDLSEQNEPKTIIVNTIEEIKKDFEDSDNRLSIFSLENPDLVVLEKCIRKEIFDKVDRITDNKRQKSNYNILEETFTVFKNVDNQSGIL